MESITDFDKFYNDTLLPLMPKLKKESREKDMWGFMALGFAAAAVISFLCDINKMLEGVSGFLIFISLVGFGVAIYQYTVSKDRFTDDMKNSIIKNIIDHVQPGIEYKPDECVKESEFKASSLFREYYDYFDGSDYMQGFINNIPFNCSELLVQQDHDKRYLTIFRGLFFVFKINSAYTGGTYVWPKNLEQQGATLMDEYRLRNMPPVRDIKFGDSAFSKYFSVSTTFPSQATQILSAGLRQQMVDLAVSLYRPISFSFVAGKCYLAIPFPKNLLEPTSYQVDDKKELMKYYVTVQLIVKVISNLALGNLQ